MVRPPTVVLMCGLPGSGKSTYAARLVEDGYARLSLDEVIWHRLGERDPGTTLDTPSFNALKEEVRAEQRSELVALIRAGRDVVVDYTFWSRAARDDYKALVERHEGRWRLVHLEVDKAELRRRLAIRSSADGADSVTVDDDLLTDYLTKFEAPQGEGEETPVSGSSDVPAASDDPDMAARDSGSAVRPRRTGSRATAAGA